MKQVLVKNVDLAGASGRAVTIDPPPTPSQIEDLEARCGALPAEVHELAEYSGGFSVGDIRVSLRGDILFEFQPVFEFGVAVATDGHGNFWVVDVEPNGVWGAVFLVAHDPPVLILQARDLATFLVEVFDPQSTVRLGVDATAGIWNSNPYVVSRAQGLASSDRALRMFAAGLDDKFEIADLRDKREGAGFVWGSAGPDTEIRRAGGELLFAVERKVKKRGLLARLLARA
jgi:hypothetical protein